METKTALVCIAKGENRYIREWCEWHKNIGFDEIYIYDNNLVGERIDEAVGDLPYVHINNRYRNALQRNVEIQLKCYNEWYRAHRGDFTHFAFLDCDEFLNVSDDFNGLKDYIARVVKNAEGTRLYWKCHSDSGNLRYEDKPVRERFPQVVEPKDGRYFYKMLFSTGREDFKMINVHFSNHLPNIIDCNGNRINYSQSTYARDGVVYDCAWVDHYITKSAEEYFRNKRGKKDDARRLTVGFFFNFNEHTDEKDRYVAELVGIDVATVAKSNAGALEVHIGRKPETVVLDGMLEDTVKVLPQKQAEAPKAVAGQEPKPAQVGEYPEGVSVCISAYQTQDYIEKCLDSVEAQTWFKSHSNWEVLLGIDGCEKTLEKVRDIMHKYRNLHVFMMDENVGTYVTTNTIMKETKYKWLLRFDSDDVMMPNMVEELMLFKKEIQPCFVQYRYCDFIGNFQKKSNSTMNARGSVFYNRLIFEKYGGYRDWRCAADFEMLERLKNFVMYYEIKHPLFYRRKHSNNLTSSIATGMKSDYRASLHKQIHSPTNEKDAIILCKTQQYKKITLTPLVSFLIVNRGGKELKKVINNINNTFKCEKEIIIINQTDNDFFKRGQLFNIGYKYAKGDYLVLMDNDIIILHPFDIIKKYNEIGKPYLPFTRVSQLTYTDDTRYTITKTEERPSGFGAFAVVSRTDFVNSNGFSNLCMNWGGEDNIFNIKIKKFHRIDDNIGHITHPSRSTPITEKHRSINNEAYTLYNKNKITYSNDGFQQTTFEEVYDKLEDGVRYIGVKNISVTNDYIYKTILNKHYE